MGRDCEFDKMNLKEAIMLAIVMHTNSPKLQAEIIAQNMAYDRMVEKARAIELTKKEVENIQNKGDAFQVDAVGSANSRVQYRPWSNRGKGAGNNYRGNADYKETEQGRRECQQCGYRGEHVCRAKQETCYKCQRKGHFGRMCRNKQKYVQTVRKEMESEDQCEWYGGDYQLDQIEITAVEKDVEKERGYPSTQVRVCIAGSIETMKVDSGADANIISADCFNTIQQKQKKRIVLKKSKAKLTPFNSPPIKIQGVFRTMITRKGGQVETEVYVTQSSNTKSIMSKFTAFDLGILHITVDELTSVCAFKKDNKRKRTPEVQHMSYAEVAKRMTTEENIINQLSELHVPTDSPKQVEKIVDKFSEVFKAVTNIVK